MFTKTPAKEKAYFVLGKSSSSSKNASELMERQAGNEMYSNRTLELIDFGFLQTRKQTYSLI
jgi:hypothetical protein